MTYQPPDFDIAERVERRSRLAGWHEYDPTSPCYVPSGAGCYAIIIGNEVVYVGQARDLRARFYGHQLRWSYSPHIITPWGPFLDVRLKIRTYRRYGQWAMSELRLIRRLQPRFNKVGRRRKAVAA